MDISLNLGFDEGMSLCVLNLLAQHNAMIIRMYDDAAVRENRKPLPPLYESGIYYEREEGEIWGDYLNTLSEGHEDCDALAAIRAGELIARGYQALTPRDERDPVKYPGDGGLEDAHAGRVEVIPAEVMLKTTAKGGRPGLYHCVVRYWVPNANGEWIEYRDDPSARLGMLGDSAESRQGLAGEPAGATVAGASCGCSGGVGGPQGPQGPALEGPGRALRKVWGPAMRGRAGGELAGLCSNAEEPPSSVIDEMNQLRPTDNDKWFNMYVRTRSVADAEKRVRKNLKGLGMKSLSMRVHNTVWCANGRPVYDVQVRPYTSSAGFGEEGDEMGRRMLTPGAARNALPANSLCPNGQAPSALLALLGQLHGTACLNIGHVLIQGVGVKDAYMAASNAIQSAGMPAPTSFYGARSTGYCADSSPSLIRHVIFESPVVPPGPGIQAGISDAVHEAQAAYDSMVGAGVFGAQEDTMQAPYGVDQRAPMAPTAAHAQTGAPAECPNGAAPLWMIDLVGDVKETSNPNIRHVLVDGPNAQKAKHLAGRMFTTAGLPKPTKFFKVLNTGFCSGRGKIWHVLAATPVDPNSPMEDANALAEAMAEMDEVYEMPAGMGGSYEFDFDELGRGAPLDTPTDEMGGSYEFDFHEVGGCSIEEGLGETPEMGADFEFDFAEVGCGISGCEGFGATLRPSKAASGQSITGPFGPAPDGVGEIFRATILAREMREGDAFPPGLGGALGGAAASVGLHVVSIGEVRPSGRTVGNKIEYLVAFVGIELREGDEMGAWKMSDQAKRLGHVASLGEVMNVTGPDGRGRFTMIVDVMDDGAPVPAQCATATRTAEAWAAERGMGGLSGQSSCHSDPSAAQPIGKRRFEVRFGVQGEAAAPMGYVDTAEVYDPKLDTEMFDPKIATGIFDGYAPGYFGGETFHLKVIGNVESKRPYEEGNVVTIYIPTKRPQTGHKVKDAVTRDAEKTLEKVGYDITSLVKVTRMDQSPDKQHGYYLWGVKFNVKETMDQIQAAKAQAEAAQAELDALQEQLAAAEKALEGEKKTSGSQRGGLVSRIKRGGRPMTKSTAESELESMVATLVEQINMLLMAQATTLVGPPPAAPLQSVEEHQAADAAAATAAAQGYILPGYPTPQGEIVQPGFIYDMPTGTMVPIHGSGRDDRRGGHRAAGPDPYAQPAWSQPAYVDPFAPSFPDPYGPSGEGYWPTLDDSEWYSTDW